MGGGKKSCGSSTPKGVRWCSREQPLLEGIAFLITLMGCPEPSQLSMSQCRRHLRVSGESWVGNRIEVIMPLWPLLAQEIPWGSQLGIQGGSHQQV